MASLLEDHTGALWVGTDGGGLNLFREGRFRAYRARDGLPADRVIALAEDREGSLWIGTFGGGVARLREGRFTVIGRALGLSSDQVLALTVDASGRLWVGTDGGGLNVLENGRFKVYTTEHGLAHNTVSRVYEDGAGTLWIGTSGGLTLFRQGKLSTITHRDGLFQDGIFQVLEDDQGRLWMSGNKGISYVDKKALADFAEGRANSVASVSFGTSDGMRSSECNGSAQPAGWKARDGTLWFPTTKGAVRVDPARMPMNTLPPPVSIEEVAIDGRAYDPQGTAVVSPGRGEIEVHYAGLSFLEPEKVRFKYRLEGFDQGWVDPGTRRVAYYTNIPPGAYRFRVAAANNDGVWNEEGASFAFELKPHVYQASWFRVLAAMVTVGLALGAHRVHVRHLAVRENRLATLVADRTRELQEANRRLAFLADAREKEEMIALVQAALAPPSLPPATAFQVKRVTPTESERASTANSHTVEPGGSALRFAVGTVLAGRYELKEKVGQGGMGVVYRAHDRELDEEVAVKFLVPDLLASGGRSVDRFKQEIKVARRVSHHNIVRTHDFGEADGTPFISMEYVVGVTLKDLVARVGPVPLGVGLRIAKEICQGLDAAHREGIIHRDVKPHNVLILPDKGELKIMDFGIARASRIHAPGTTVAGTIIGTPAYMSPEQALGKPADMRSDIYSLGVLFFEMFLGRLPFSGDTAMEVLHHHIQTPPPPARSLNPGFPVGLETVIQRCLAKDPADRYPSVSDILPELAAISTSLDPSA